jgi:hypothetical protein
MPSRTPRSSTAIAICVIKYRKLMRVIQTTSALEASAVAKVHPRRTPELPMSLNPPNTRPRYTTAVAV